jgi:hypothetical protein
MRILAFLFLLSSLYPSEIKLSEIELSEIKLSTTQSVFHTLEKSDIYFHLQYSQLSITDNFSYGAQWWPSNNLYLTGLLSNLIIKIVNETIEIENETIEKDRSLYHHISLGYSNPDWKIKFLTTNVIEVGVHRLRYFDDKIYRWFHTGLKTRASYKRINVGVDFTRFFYDTWATNRFTLSMSKTLNGNININGGIIRDEYNSFTPYVGVSIGI